MRQGKYLSGEEICVEKAHVCLERESHTFGVVYITNINVLQTCKHMKRMFNFTMDKNEI